MQLGLYADIDNGSLLPNEQFAFIEENVQTLLLPERGDAHFQRRLEVVRSLQKPVYAANRFLPPDLRVTGPDVDAVRLEQWARTALARAETVGIKILVWGSGAARKIPEGWSRDAAWDQFTEAVKLVAPIAADHGVTIVIEPVCRHDSNFIMSLADGARIVHAVSHPAVRLLADFWHMHHENEPATEIERFGDILEHVHLSEFGLDRAEPGRRGDDFRPYLQCLKNVGYDKGLVIETNWTDIGKEAPAGLTDLRRQMAEVGLS
jgi:sugar phosphate isomerase/epimerase